MTTHLLALVAVVPGAWLAALAFVALLTRGVRCHDGCRECER